MALYPPIIASSLPAFDIGTGEIPLSFSLSKYNSLSEIKTVQVSIHRHASNVNVIQNSLLCNLQMPQQKDQKTGLYNIRINIKQNNINIEPGVLYRVQLRFANVPPAQASADIYTNNPSLHSEWSTVCIIKPIEAPLFYLKDLDTENDSDIVYDEQSTALDYVTADFVGVYKSDTEILQKWRLRLLDESYMQGDDIDEHTYIDSGWNFIGAYQYTSDTKGNVVFNCNLNYEFPSPDDGGPSTYQVYFEIQTRNGYIQGKLYYFDLAFSRGMNDTIPRGKIQTIVNEEQGYIKIIYSSYKEDKDLTNWVLRRTSSTSNFQYWEDIKYFYTDTSDSEDKSVYQEYIDYTPESGIIYKYGIQNVNIYGRRGELKASKECMGQWEHAFLLEGYDTQARQLKLKYDFDISSYKTNISESKTDTIGSRYPFIRRNGNMYYRSFPVTGIITALMDDEELFTDNGELYGQEPIKVGTTRRQGQTNEDIYEEFFGEYDNYVNRYNYTHERKFRERVEAFLYNNNVKLYKSMQEGNILVKLMEVSLTPKKELGRLIYTFSATAYQVANVHEVYWHNNNLRGAAARKLSQLTNLGAGVFSDSNVNIIQTLNDNGFFNIGTYEENLSTLGQWRLGQISCFGDYNVNTTMPNVEITNLTDIRKEIIRKYWNNLFADTNISPETIIPDADPDDNVIISNMYIKNIHIEINNPPYLNSNQSSGVALGTFYEKNNNNELGTMINFNGSNILVAPPHNIYNIMDDNVFDITNTPFSIGDGDHPFIGTVDFEYQFKYKIDTSKEVYKSVSRNVNGFLDYSDITLNANLINIIQNKYIQNYTTDDGDRVKQQINGVNEIVIDADPGTVLELTQTGSQDTQTIYMNETGILHLDTLVSADLITSLKVKGVLEKGVLNIKKMPNILLYYSITARTDRTRGQQT